MSIALARQDYVARRKVLNLAVFFMVSCVMSGVVLVKVLRRLDKTTCTLQSLYCCGDIVVPRVDVRAGVYHAVEWSSQAPMSRTRRIQMLSHRRLFGCCFDHYRRKRPSGYPNVWMTNSPVKRTNGTGVRRS